MEIANNCSIKSVSTGLTREEWLEVRQTGLGGSDASVVMGQNKWNTPFALWAEKRGEVVSDFTGNEATRWGNRLERAVAEEYAERENACVVAYPATLVSKLRSWQLANVDFFIMAHDHNGLYPAGKVTDIDAGGGRSLQSLFPSAIPTAIPLEPFTNKLGRHAGKRAGSCKDPSKFGTKSTVSFSISRSIRSVMCSRRASV